MATSAERSVTCPICFEFFVGPHIPKELECPHTCCLVCLQKMVTLNPGLPITCPMGCQQKTHIPQGGVKHLPTNLQIKNLAEEHLDYQDRPGDAEGGKLVDVPKCTKHDEKMHLYCNLCNKLACQKCVLVYHRESEHKIFDVGDVTEERRLELNRVMTASEHELKSCQNSIIELKKLENDILTEIDAQTREVDKSCDAFIDEIRKEADKLKMELNKFGDVRRHEIQNELTPFEQRESTLRFTRDIAVQTSKSSDHAYITQHTELVKKMKRMNLKTQNIKLGFDLNTAAKFVRIPTNPTFGRISATEPNVGPTGANATRRKTKLMQEFGQFALADGIGASQDGLLAVTDWRGKKVSIYVMKNNKYDHMLSLKLNAKNMHLPQDVVFCPDGKLWVARVIGIEVYSSTGNFEKMIESTGKGTHSLAITDNGNMILAGNVERDVIAVHDHTGAIIRTWKTSVQPINISVIQDTHIAIGGTGKLVVMRIDNGQETHSVWIDEIESVCYDKITDSVLVSTHVDLIGNRVIEEYYWRTGRKIACIAENLYNPHGMCITSDGILAAADDKTVKIYEMV